MKPEFAVLGAGNGGYAMAADLSLAGYLVNLYEHPKFEENAKSIREEGGIELRGVGRTGFAKIRGKITTDMREAIEGVDIINIVVPSFVHRVFFKAFAPYLKDGQIVLIHTGNWGCLELSNMLKQMKIKKDVKIAETSILVYACERTIRPPQANVIALKKKVLLSAIPATDTKDVLRAINEVYPQFVPAASVLETSGSNMNINHVSVMVLNAGRIESTKGDFKFWKDGVTPSVARVMQEVDDERMKVLTALGIKPTSIVEMTYDYYRTSMDSMYMSIHTLPQIEVSRAPENLEYRYLSEDIPYGLVPLASLGDLIGVPTPTMHALIQLASVLNQVDYMSEGRNVKRLGLTGLSVREIKKYVARI